MDGRDRLRGAYGATGQGAGKRRRRLAESHRPDARIERLIRLRAEDPEAFARLDATTRMSVGFYESSARAREAEEADGAGS